MPGSEKLPGFWIIKNTTPSARFAECMNFRGSLFRCILLRMKVKQRDVVLIAFNAFENDNIRLLLVDQVAFEGGEGDVIAPAELRG